MTVLKSPVSYPDGFAAMADLKRDMAILATSGRDWIEWTKRMAARVPDLDIFSQGLIERLNGGWRVSEKGRAILAIKEARPSESATRGESGVIEQPIEGAPRLAASVRLGRPNRQQRRQAARERARAKTS